MYVIIGKEKYNVYDTVILHTTRFCITRVYKEANEREKNLIIIVSTRWSQ